MLAPLLAVRDELTHTFRSRPSIVSPAEFEVRCCLIRSFCAPVVVLVVGMMVTCPFPFNHSTG